MKVWERDGFKCVICGAYKAIPACHIISRAQSGLGIEENIVTLCFDCHRAYDQTTDRKQIREVLIDYVKQFYPEWKEEDMKYDKWAWTRNLERR